MKKFLAFLLFLLFIILLWFGWKWYKETMVCCDDSVNVEASEQITPEAVEYGPLVFNWGSDEAITSALWPDKKKGVLSGASDGSILRIIGSYFKDEENNTTFENLGLARAEAARQLLIDSIPYEKMELDSKMVDVEEGAESTPFDSVDFNWAVRNENVQEVDNKTLIYFPTNSSKKIDNANINDYFSRVAETLKNNDQLITVTGYTDNSGEPAYNKWLGMRRAEATKKLLVNLGVDASRITVASEGEAQPIATNETEEGRQKNRRVELEIK